MTLDAAVRAVRSIPHSYARAALAGVVALIAICAAVVALTYAPREALFAQPLRPEQVAEVQEQLAQWSVPFTPAADNVIVEVSRRNEILLRLSLAGVPHQHITSTQETLSTIGALTPQTVIDAQTRNGLAGDIELALRSIAGVDDARVIIAPATVAEFADESPRDASASVRLVLHPGATVSREAVAGIRAFVAAGVAGLDPARVTILDDRGVALGDRAAPGDDADGLQRSLQSALDAVLGSGTSLVRVNVAYARAASETREVRRVPLGSADIDRTAITEAYADASKRYQRSDEHDARGSETRETVVQSTPGAVMRISTAVIVDAQRSPDLASVRAIAAATVGFDRNRGDTLDVEAVNFHRVPDAKRDGWFLAYGAIVPLLPNLAIVVGVFALSRSVAPHVMSFISTHLERFSSARTLHTVAGYAPAQVRGALANEPPHAAAAIISALPAATAAAVLELYPQQEREAIVRRMQRANTPLIPDVDEVLGRHA